MRATKRLVLIVGLEGRGGEMEIRERIEQCLSTLDSRRQMIVAFEDRLRAVVEALKQQKGLDAGLGNMLLALEEVLGAYNEISLSCGEMIEGLKDVGLHVEKIEDGRSKIVSGVEAIISRLQQLEALAAQGFQVGVNAPGADAATKPKRVLLIRIRPETADSPEGHAGEAPGVETSRSEDQLLRFRPGKRETVH
jgi:hypothetical protein